MKSASGEARFVASKVMPRTGHDRAWPSTLAAATKANLLTGDNSRGGFTLLEVVLALSVMSILMGVLFTAHAELLRAGDRDRAMNESTRAMGRIAARNWRGEAPVNAAAGEPFKVEFLPVQTTHGTSQVTWFQWTLAPSNRPEAGVAFCLRHK